MQQHRAAWRRSFSWLVLLIFSLLSCMPQAELNQISPPSNSSAASLDSDPLNAENLRLQPTPSQQPLTAHFTETNGQRQEVLAQRQWHPAQEQKIPTRDFNIQSISTIESLKTRVGTRENNQELHYRVTIHQPDNGEVPKYLRLTLLGPQEGGRCYAQLNAPSFLYTLNFGNHDSTTIDVQVIFPELPFEANGTYEAIFYEHSSDFDPNNMDASVVSAQTAEPLILNNHQNFTLIGNQTTADVSKGEALNIGIEYTSGDIFEVRLSGPQGSIHPIDGRFIDCMHHLTGFSWPPPAHLEPGTYQMTLRLIDFPGISSNTLPITILNPSYVDPNPTPTPSPEPTTAPPGGGNGGDNNGSGNDEPNAGECLDQSVPPAALAPLMSDLNALSGGGFSTQSLSASDLRRFAQLKDHPPQQAAEKAQLKASMLAQLDQLDARLAALQQRSAEDFGMLYGPYTDPVHDSDLLQYKTMADELAEHVSRHLASQNSHALFYASQAYLKEVSLLAHVTRRYLNGTLSDLAPNQTVIQLIQSLEYNTARHLSQLQQQYQQLSATFERLKAEEAQLALAWAAWQPRLDAIRAAHEAFKQKLEQLNIEIGGFSTLQMSPPDEGADDNNTDAISIRLNELQQIQRERKQALEGLSKQSHQLKTELKNSVNPVQKAQLRAQIKLNQELQRQTRQEIAWLENEIKALWQHKLATEQNKADADQTSNGCAKPFDRNGGSGVTPGGVMYNYDKKMGKQLIKRGWTPEILHNVIDNPKQIIPTVDHRNRGKGQGEGPGGNNNDPATAYYNSDIEHVVLRNSDGNIVHVSNRTDKDFVPDFDVPEP